MEALRADGEASHVNPDDAWTVRPLQEYFTKG